MPLTHWALNPFVVAQWLIGLDRSGGKPLRRSRHSHPMSKWGELSHARSIFRFDSKFAGWEICKNLTLPIGALALVLGVPAAQAATCTPTGYVRDSINLTAALINPPGKVSGDVDATGCNIGVYYGPGAHGKVEQANIHGANYFGIVNNGADVDILDSTVSDIGEKPFNGTQHGKAIYFVFGSAATGSIKRNFIWAYQKGGIIVNGSASRVDIEQNRVIGLGPVSFIAQNGIQVAYGAKARVRQNFVTGNSYTGSNLASSGGILVVGGGCFASDLVTDLDIEQNVALNNDVGIWLFQAEAGCASPPTTPTKIDVSNNSVFNNAINNTTGNGPTQGYQAGIADTGNGDVIKRNDVCGLGYTPPGTASAALFDIDVTFTNNPVVDDNTTCSSPRRHRDFDHHGDGHARPSPHYHH
jgi:hypothetical protein